MSTKKQFKTPQEALRYHVTGAIERGEAQAIGAVTEPKHASGPWKNTGGIPFFNVGDVVSIKDADGNLAAWACRDNAPLIAAAPEMLEMLKRFPDDSPYSEAVKILIAKAEGRE